MDETFLRRFWAKIDKSGGPDACWPWTARAVSCGYGVVRYRGRTLRAHRVVLGLFEKTPGREVCHSCNNRICCNPGHLRLGTRSDNMRDAVKAGTHVHCVFVGEEHPSCRLTEADVREIRREYAGGGVTQKSLGEKYGVTHCQIHLIVRRKKWKHVT